MIDKEFTKEIQAVVQADTLTAELVLKGADLLRRINPSNMVYMRWLQLAGSRPDYVKAHIVAELKKHLQYRLDELTREDVRALDIKVQANVAETVDKPRTGKRDDHDSLPDFIQALWDENAQLYKRIKDKFEECKSLNDQPACDRYEVLKVLAELDDKYRKQMQEYDNYVLTSGDNDVNDNDNEVEPLTPEEQEAKAAKDVANARTYISRNIDKLEGLCAAAAMPDADESVAQKRDELKAKLSERVDILVENKAVIGDALIQRLNSVGINLDAQDQG